MRGRGASAQRTAHARAGQTAPLLLALALKLYKVRPLRAAARSTPGIERRRPSGAEIGMSSHAACMTLRVTISGRRKD
eukprot:COSAG05_NODE_2698_length_2755_cov_1.658133_3_plen_78_part_00